MQQPRFIHVVIFRCCLEWLLGSWKLFLGAIKVSRCIWIIGVKEPLVKKEKEKEKRNLKEKNNVASLVEALFLSRNYFIVNAIL